MLSSKCCPLAIALAPLLIRAAAPPFIASPAIGSHAVPAAPFSSAFEMRADSPLPERPTAHSASSAARRAPLGAPVALPGVPVARALLLADLDRDGLPDLITASVDGLRVAPGAGRSGVAPFSAASPADAAAGADLLAAGDFDGDGRIDVIAAARGAAAFWFLAGDGRGGLGAPRRMAAGGAIAALAAGEWARRDGLTDLALALDTPSGAALMVYHDWRGALAAEPLRIALGPGRAGPLAPYERAGRAGLLATAGERLLHFEGAALVAGGRPAGALRLAAPPGALAVGRFDGDSPEPQVIALLAGGELARVEFLAGGNPRLAASESLPAGARAPGALRLAAARIASGPGDELLLLDPAAGALEIRFPAGRDATAPLRVPMAADALLPFAPAGAGRAGLLVSGSTGIDWLAPLAGATFTVNSTLDTDDANPGDGLCNDGAGNCTLRAAITEANLFGGPDHIVFSLGTGTPSITLTAPLSGITETLSIDGRTGGADRVEINAGNLGATVLSLLAGADGCVIRSLVINRTGLCGSTNCGIGIRVYSAGNAIQDCYIGPDAAGGGTVPSLKGDAIWLIGGGAYGNLIGGSTAADRNLLSNGNIHAIRIEGGTDNSVYGNYLGVTPDGSGLLRNGAYGVTLRTGSNGNRIGDAASAPGTAPGNLISGNDRGVSFYAGADYNTVQGNIIGANAAGTLGLIDQPNGGIDVEGSSNLVIGGATAPYRNLLSGNKRCAIFMNNNGGAASSNAIIGNYIGTDLAGAAAVPNGTPGGDSGIWIYSSSSANPVSGNQIGGATAAPGTGAGNVIAGNAGNGMWLTNGLTSGTVIAGNYIGLNAAGAALPNGSSGISIGSAPSNLIGGGSVSLRNVIYGGVSIDGFNAGSAAGNLIQGNYLGVNLAGSASLGGTNCAGVTLTYGVKNTTIGGLTATPGQPPGNLISGCSGGSGNGVYLYDATTTDNVIQGNLIGTDATGTAAIPNGTGVYMSLARNNTVGGTAPGARNVISGNVYHGVQTYYGANTVLGNYIGSKIDGVGALGNGRYGVELGSFSDTYPVDGPVVGDGTVAGRNVIISNGWGGVDLYGHAVFHAQVRGNYIGVGADGTTARGNGSTGVSVNYDSHDNFIGGTAGLTAGACTGDCNLIANHPGGGVYVSAPAGGAGGVLGNLIVGNSLINNGPAGIDLLPNSGVTANDAGDADAGANRLLNYPVVNPFGWNGTNSTVSGTLNTLPNASGIAIDLYNSATPYGGANRGAGFWVGRITGLSTDAGGNLSWALVVPGQLGFVTATATDAANDTSELSAVATQVAGADADGDGVVDASDCAPADGTAWATPGDPRLLMAAGRLPTALAWQPPAFAGGTALVYDALRSTNASNFTTAACLASNTTGLAANDPDPNASYFYLIRAENACGGTPAGGGSCP